MQKNFFAPKKKNKKKIGGCKKYFCTPPKKKKVFLGRKKIFEGGFQASAGILWFFVSTTTDTAKHHSAAVTLTMRESGARMFPAIVDSFSSSRKASEVIMWECISLCMGTECNFPLAALAEVHLKIFFRSLRSRKDTPM